MSAAAAPPAEARRPKRTALDGALVAMAVFWGLLVAVTWPLWAGDAFPQLAPLGLFRTIPAGGDGLLTLGLLAFVAAAVITRVRGRADDRWWMGAITLQASLWLLDAHRLQPWAWQFALVALLASFGSRALLRHGWVALVGSVYIFSAISKLDAAFFERLGPLFVETGWSVVGLSRLWQWSPAALQVLAWSLPLGELIVAGLWLVPRWRRWGFYGSVLLHAGLILILGPWGLNHSWGVLLWNVYFLVQNFFLYRADDTAADLPATRPWERGVILLLFCYPVLEPLGLLNHWLGWSVYSARPAQIRLLMPADDRDRCGEELKPYFVDVPPEQGLALGEWEPLYELRFDRWSLATTWAPLLPDRASSLRIAREVSRRHRLESPILIVNESPDRRTGRRKERVWRGADAVNEVGPFPETIYDVRPALR